MLLPMKGIIALDIDGTITPNHHFIPLPVIDYFVQLHGQGWHFIFITGRPFQWGYETLAPLPFPYYFAVQNGAIILEMESRKILQKKYLDKTILPVMEQICREEPTDFVIYAGYEHQDHCFFRPTHFSDSMLNYLHYRCNKLEEVWKPMSDFSTLHIEQFPSIKCIGDQSCIERISAKIEEQLQLHIPLIHDPIDRQYLVAQATHPQVNKGQALLDLIEVIGKRGILIAAGDDNNDKTMLEKADIKVVMASAPQEILKMAHIIAPPASENGIIEGLRQAIIRSGK